MATVTDSLIVECPKCGACCSGERTPHLKHYAKARCGCGNFWWIRKPDSDPSKYKRPKSTTNLAQVDYCEMCERKRDELPKNCTLEGHHVVEVEDGGSNDPANIWPLCTACHRLVHWARTYHGTDC